MDSSETTSRRDEVSTKLATVRALLHAHHLDALTLTTVANTAWITAGASTYVNESVEDAACQVLVTPDEAVVVTDSIEAPRLREEEQLEAFGFRIIQEPWHRWGIELPRKNARQRVGDDRNDVDVSIALREARTMLAPSERARLREGGRRAGQAMGRAISALRPGMTEHHAASMLSAAAREEGGSPIVVLVGSDERIRRYRHPLPTAKSIERYVMLVLCFRYRGLVTALTRAAHWGVLPAELDDTAHRVARIDAMMIGHTVPGATLGEMFEMARQAYADEGRPEAIDEHHQGGSIAYLAREALARPGDTTPICLGQAFAWNPSLRGAKSEDTLLLTAKGPEIATSVPDWPMWTAGLPMPRPAIAVW